ncbi:Uncharacterised protein [Mycobacteroides abscessus subsp. abscessus]|nr:Uncharacterised protein [Mycobacteroides abscessus subsp. abscessus]
MGILQFFFIQQIYISCWQYNDIQEQIIHPGNIFFESNLMTDIDIPLENFSVLIHHGRYRIKFSLRKMLKPSVAIGSNAYLFFFVFDCQFFRNFDQLNES